MNVKLLAHTQLSEDFRYEIEDPYNRTEEFKTTHGQAVALTAIRTCYSPGLPSEIVAKEGAKYFGAKATDGKAGTEADRLFRMIVSSGHTSTLEHLSFTFAIEGVSRALLAQLTRHRVGFSFSVQSQRYVRFGSGDRSGGMSYVIPDTVKKNEKETPFYNVAESRVTDHSAEEIFETAMISAQEYYDALRSAGVPAEDARAVLPNAAATNLVMTANLRGLLEFYSKRKPGNGAQKEIADLATELKNAVIAVEPWTAQFFESEAK
ncbi:FAD-dependent thymidylate synthase [Niallia sp. FSL M8-0099]|uniref:FAD-dependent thymidylate synthase n=1 Tax=Niallia sp. FSL M8-0099 TaxID=2954519 RepID=UPI0030FAF21D